MVITFGALCRLKPLDVEFMKRLHDKVNIIPMIAKADTLTPDECREFKKTVSASFVSLKKLYFEGICDNLCNNSVHLINTSVTYKFNWNCCNVSCIVCTFYVCLLQILNEIAQHKIKIYEFPDCDDEEENRLQKKLKVTF